MPLTHRQARKKLGTRSSRRRNTNGKNVPGAPLGPGGRIVFKFKHPHPSSNRVRNEVARLVKESSRDAA